MIHADGGGVRGLAALVVLEQVMEVANEERRKFGLPRQEPWQMFDIIGGTSTGGYGMQSVRVRAWLILFKPYCNHAW